MTREVCTQCLRPRGSCYCHSIRKIHTTNHILILRHHSETTHPFNTARMAELGLIKCNIIESDDENFESIIKVFIDKYEPFLLFKSMDSISIESNRDDIDNKSFIVIDGTWSKAKSILHANEQLQKLPTYHINDGGETIYKDIRRSCSEEHLSTLEAIRFTLEQQEGKDFSALLSPLKELIRQQKEFK